MSASSSCRKCKDRSRRLDTSGLLKYDSSLSTGKTDDKYWEGRYHGTGQRPQEGISETIRDSRNKDGTETAIGQEGIPETAAHNLRECFENHPQYRTFTSGGRGYRFHVTHARVGSLAQTYNTGPISRPSSIGTSSAAPRPNGSFAAPRLA